MTRDNRAGLRHEHRPDPFRFHAGVNLHYRLDGPEQAPVLVFSNSLGTDLRMWEPQVGPLASRFRLLRYDTRGHGGSPLLPGPYSIEELGRDAVGLLDELDIESADFCGLSLGGLTGLWLGAYASQRVRTLVLCNTAPRIGTAQAWEDRIRLVRTEGMSPVAESAPGRWFTPQFCRRNPPAVEAMKTMLAATSPVGYAACCAALRDADLWDECSRITTPTLVIAGAVDPVTPPELGRRMASHLATSMYVELPAAHLSNVEADVAFTNAVLDFLGGCAPGAAGASGSAR